MTWWRQSRDASGMTIVDRMDEKLTFLVRCVKARVPSDSDWNEYLAYKGRTASILRRLKRCPKCHGTGKVPGLEERGGPWLEYQVLIEEECMACGGKGTVSFDTKEGTQDARTN